jgi:hypothetical protein
LASSQEEYAVIVERTADAKAKLASGVTGYVATGFGSSIDFEQRAIELLERVIAELDSNR